MGGNAASKALVEACQLGRLAEAQQAVKDGGKATFADWSEYEHGETALHAACRHGHLDVAVWLYASVRGTKSTVTQTAKDGWTPFHAASDHGHLAVVQWLYASVPEAKPTVTQCCNYGGTPFHAACMNGHLPVAKWLAGLQEAAGYLEMPNQQGKTPLEVANPEVQDWLRGLLEERATDAKEASEAASGSGVTEGKDGGADAHVASAAGEAASAAGDSTGAGVSDA